MDVNHEESEVLKSKLPLSNLASIDSVHVVSYIQQSQDKTATALHLAQHYRTVAENVRSESLKRQKEAEEKVEIVRNFWRNKICDWFWENPS